MAKDLEVPERYRKRRKELIGATQNEVPSFTYRRRRVILCVALILTAATFVYHLLAPSQVTRSINGVFWQAGEQGNTSSPGIKEIISGAMNSTKDAIMSFNPLSQSNDFDAHEIARLVGDYYSLMAKMRYFPSDAIKFPPHDPPIDVEYARSLGLEPQVIELMQLLPYVEGYNNEDEFIMYGSFADLRNKDVLEQSRDPAFASPEGGFNDENGLYVKPWVLVLNECGNHGSIMYLDTRTGKITMQWQADTGTADPFFRDRDPSVVPEPDVPTGKNRNAYDHLPSRHARDLFADFTARLMSLEWIPYDNNGMTILRSYASEGFPEVEYQDVKLMFLTYGWPDNFDSFAFDAAKKRYQEFDDVRGDSWYSKDIVEETTRAKKLRDSIAGLLQKHKARLHNGIWDGNPDMDKMKVEVLVAELHKMEDIMQQKEETLRIALEAGKNIGNEAEEMEKAWERHIEGDIGRKMRDLEWYQGEGKKYATEENMKEIRKEVEDLRERLKTVATLPKTAMEAISPR